MNFGDLLAAPSPPTAAVLSRKHRSSVTLRPEDILRLAGQLLGDYDLGWHAQDCDRQRVRSTSPPPRRSVRDQITLVMDRGWLNTSFQQYTMAPRRHYEQAAVGGSPPSCVGLPHRGSEGRRHPLPELPHPDQAPGRRPSRPTSRRAPARR